MSARALFWLLLLLLAAPAAAQEEPLLVIDTDSAFFNDDCAALSLLLQSELRDDLLGITVVSGNLWAPQGAEYLLHVLELFERQDVPLYVGAHRPLVNTPEEAAAMAEQWGGLSYRGAFDQPYPARREDLQPPCGGAFAQLRPQRQDAVSFLIEAIESHPDRITILALGPLTNLAILIRLRPDLAPRIARLVIMGGNVRVPGNVTHGAEFNFWFDPEAARAVLRSAIPEKVLFGLDVSNQVVLDKARFDAIAQAETPIARIFREDYGERYPGFFAHPERTTHVWDCLPAAWLIDPAIATAEETLALDVDTTFGPSYGATLAPPRRPGRHARPVRVILGLDVERFFALHRDLLTRPVPVR